MLGVESGIPVNFGEVEAKKTIFCSDFDIHVRIPGQQLEFEGAKLAMRANVIDLVNDRPNSWVFIQNDFCNQFLIRQIFLSQIKVGLLNDSQSRTARMSRGIDLPTWPIMLKPEGNSSPHKSSGRIAFMISSSTSQISIRI